MSHVSYLELEVKDLSALKSASEACGLEFVEGQSKIRWYGRWVGDYHGDDAAFKHGIDPSQYGRCDHVLRIPGTDGQSNQKYYDVGVMANPDGSFKIYYDHFGPGEKLTKLIGTGGIKLKQQYAKAIAVATLKQKGFRLAEEHNLAGGGMQLVLKGQQDLA